MYTLITPEGIEFKGETPLRCCRAELGFRLTDEERLANIIKFIFGVCFICEKEFKEDDEKHYIARGTSANFGPLCSTCLTIIKKDLGVCD